jgi:hypothetical protein
MLQASILPEFNPVSAGYPLAPQGRGPNELLPLGYFGEGEESYGDKVKTYIATNPVMAVGIAAVFGAAALYGYYRYVEMR